MSIKHKEMPLVLETYELDEVYIPWGRDKKIAKVIRITIHGKNIFQRALEPIIKVGDDIVQFPEIQPDEQTIIGYLTKIPKEGAPITFGYGEKPQVQMKELFKSSKIRKLSEPG